MSKLLTFDEVLFHTHTLCPCFTRFFTIPTPITPRPRKPITEFVAFIFFLLDTVLDGVVSSKSNTLAYQYNITLARLYIDCCRQYRLIINSCYKNTSTCYTHTLHHFDIIGFSKTSSHNSHQPSN